MHAERIATANAELSTETHGKDSEQYSFDLDAVLTDDDEKYVAYVNASANTGDCETTCEYNVDFGSNGLAEDDLAQFTMTLALSA